MTTAGAAWTAAAAAPSLSDRDVHVWQVRLDRAPAAVERLAGLLSADERDRGDRFHFDRDRRRFIAARGALRALLGGYVGVPAAALRFEYGDHGKPRLAGAGAPAFNVSHSEDLALIAVSAEGALGIDVEAVRDVRDRDEIAARFFSAAEYAGLQALPERVRGRAFFSCWTRKEAFVKAIGDGLSRPLDSFDVTFAPGAAARLSVAGDPSESARWQVTPLAPADEFEAALVAEGAARAVTRWTWIDRDDDAAATAACDIEEAV